MELYNYFIIAPLILLVVLGFMIGWELGVAAAMFTSGVGFFINSMNPYSSPLWLYFSIAFGIIGIVLFFDSYRRIGSRKKNLELRKQNITRLSELRKEGVDVVLHKGLHEVNTDEQAENWWKEVIEWTNKVRNVMNEIHPAHADNWQTLGTFVPKLIDGDHGHDMNKKLSEFNTRLDRLWEYIDSRSQNDKNE